MVGKKILEVLGFVFFCGKDFKIKAQIKKKIVPLNVQIRKKLYSNVKKAD